MAGYLWDPFVTLGRLDREFDEIVRRTWGGRDRGARSPRPGFVPAADVLRDGDDIVVNIELPGVDLDNDVTVEVDRGRLVVHGERTDGVQGDGGGLVLRERRLGAFRREFALPERVGAEQVSASYDRGVLAIRLSGAAAQPRSTRIPVAVGTARAPEAEAAPPAAQPTPEPAAAQE